MDLYSIALFFHIAGALGFFAALGLEAVGFWQIRTARNAEQVRTWMGVLRSTRRVGMISMLTILIFGVYMTAKAWGATGWIVVSLVAFVLEAVLPPAFIMPRMAAIMRALPGENGPLSPSMHALTNHPVLRISNSIRVAVGLGIVFVMTVKPDAVGSVLAIAATFVLGLGYGMLPEGQRERAHQGSAD